MKKLKNMKGISTRHNQSVRIKNATAGITLIALVVTIIILLILIGVAISILMGDKGLITKTQYLKFYNEYANIDELKNMYVKNKKIEYINNENKYEQKEIYPVGEKLNVEEFTETLDETIKAENKIENLENKKDDFYKIDMSKLEKNDNIYYIIDITTGKIYNYVGFKLRNKVYHIPEIYIDENKNSGNNEPDSGKEEENNIAKEWLSAGELENKYQYQTIEEILNDTNCLNDLMNSKESVDYIIGISGDIISIIANSKNALTAISNSSIATIKLVQSKEWMDKISNSPYKTYFDNNSKKVPKLSNNGDSNILASSTHAAAATYTFYPFHAFDQDDITIWGANEGKISGEYIGYKFDKESYLYKVEITNRPEIVDSFSIQYISKFRIQGSNDGNVWNDITSQLSIQSTIAKGKSTYYIGQENTYSMYRIYIDSAYKTAAGLAKLQFYCKEKPDIVNDDLKGWLKFINIDCNVGDYINLDFYINKLMNSTEAVDYMIMNKNIIENYVSQSEKAVEELSKSNYASYKIVTNKECMEIINKSKYEYVFDENAIVVPKLTSDNNTNAFASSTHAPTASSYFYPYFAFNQSTTNIWGATAGKISGEYVGYNFQKDTYLYKVKITNRATILSNYEIKSLLTYKIQGSNDGSTWNDISTTLSSQSSAGGGTSTHILTPENSYQRYRVYVITANGTCAGVGNMQFYCVDK